VTQEGIDDGALDARGIGPPAAHDEPDRGEREGAHPFDGDDCQVFGVPDRADEDADDQGTRAENEVIVGPNSKYVYEPETVTVDVGETVTWTWDSNNHNVVVDSVPAGASWQGHESIENDGFSFEHTFDSPGVIRYVCDPHRGIGMKGAVFVALE
jgi:plastocyanin